MKQFDAVIIGAGQGGVPLGKELATSGKRTALVEQLFVGGSCVNFGCTPTKTLYSSARVAYLARRAAEFGIQLSGQHTQMADVQRRVAQVVEEFRTSSEESLQSTKRLELIRGHARFTSPRSLDVEGYGAIGAEQCFIDVGTRARIPDLAGLDSVSWLDNARVLELRELPERLVVLGGGYIGLEFAQMFRRLGSEVAVIESGERLLLNEDEDVQQAVEDMLLEDGIQLHLGQRAASVEPTATVMLESGQKVAGSHLLLSVGRTPNTDDLGLETAGIERDGKGYIKVDGRLETSAPGVFAFGDCKGGPAFTHISYDDYRILRDNLLRGGDRSTGDRPIPYVMYLDPQLGRVGPTERELRENGTRFKSVRLEADRIARASEMSETRGFIKAAIDPESGHLLSATCFCVEGGEILGMLQIAMMAKMDCRRLQDAVLSHPTLSESLNTLFSQI